MPVRTGPITRDSSTVAVGLAQIRVGNSATHIGTFGPALTSADSIGAMAETSFTSTVEFWKLTSGFPEQEDLSIPTSETAALTCSFKEITPRTLSLARGIDPTAAGSTVSAIGKTVVSSAAGTFDPTKEIACESDCPMDLFTVNFTGATSYTVTRFSTGKALGGTGAVGSASTFTIEGADAVTIPAATFTGTWASGDVFRFSTVMDGFSDNHAGSISLGGMAAPAYVRMEAVYSFPVGSHHLYIIFPRANVTSSLELAFNATDNAAPSITFEAKGASSDIAGGNAVWDTASLGRILFD